MAVASGDPVIRLKISATSCLSRGVADAGVAGDEASVRGRDGVVVELGPMLYPRHIDLPKIDSRAQPTCRLFATFDDFFCLNESIAQV